MIIVWEKQNRSIYRQLSALIASYEECTCGALVAQLAHVLEWAIVCNNNISAISACSEVLK